MHPVIVIFYASLRSVWGWGVRILMVRSFTSGFGFFGTPCTVYCDFNEWSMLGRGGAPCNGLYVQSVPCPYSPFLIAYLLN